VTDAVKGLAWTCRKQKAKIEKKKQKNEAAVMKAEEN